MKKTLIILLALTLFLPCAAAAGGSENFPPDLLDAMNWDIDGWTGNETGAAAFICMCIRSMFKVDGFTADDFDLANGAYVYAYDDSAVCGTVTLSTGKGIDFYYSPSSSYATWMKNDFTYTERSLRGTVSALEETEGFTNVRYLTCDKLTEVMALIPDE